MSKSLDRLSKLIAQADNAGTEAERETFMEAAQKLSSLINVELAVARAHNVSKERETPVSDRRVDVNSFSAKPIHRAAMMDLWLAIAGAHDIRCTVSGGNYLSFAYGFPSDIDLAEKLFGVLSVQMVREADAAIKRGDQQWVIDEGKRKIGIDGRVYRRLFYEGFTKRVAGRLYQAKRDAMRATDEADTNAGTELVMRDKAKEVDAFYEEETKHISLRGVYRGANNTDVQSNDALTHGSQAGGRANLGTSDRDLSDAGTRALS